MQMGSEVHPEKCQEVDSGQTGSEDIKKMSLAKTK
jgi:hypothetical protein